MKIMANSTLPYRPATDVLVGATDVLVENTSVLLYKRLIS